MNDKKSAPSPYARMLVRTRRVSRAPKGMRNIVGSIETDLHTKITVWCRYRGITTASFVGAAIRMLDDSGLLDELIDENVQPGDEVSVTTKSKGGRGRRSRTA